MVYQMFVIKTSSDRDIAGSKADLTFNRKPFYKNDSLCKPCINLCMNLCIFVSRSV